ncbi:hypothetical protein KO507_08725 [Gilvimarinus agarilyticus]|uniref:Plasmid stabilization system protein ParE n=1 Tax=Reichenbachiella agariperforans TaxID=156994 RepID=A0A1M6W2F4_REIAG|nr:MULTISPECIES: hypothetical protein [Reichenbachiella]MBU2885843.1 hypothetical protein [Gilvimarinus agarilyticus]MBU2915226.1 hypothetical protein [Reichenbachiella agariperforans]RJE70889.1 hypothetical protein BGP76_08890 [Reichenbachiella sp. MSK19-1]SHK87942.1 hypothetical protein SAMN04488028_11098 [Reichenbachiella agariperforans]
MVKGIIWTLTARQARQAILEDIYAATGDKNECRKFTLLLKVHLKYISKYNFAGIESNYIAMRETNCGDYKIFYKIRSGSINITGLFKTNQV